WVIAGNGPSRGLMAMVILGRLGTGPTAKVMVFGSMVQPLDWKMAQRSVPTAPSSAAEVTTNPAGTSRCSSISTLGRDLRQGVERACFRATPLRDANIMGSLLDMVQPHQARAKTQPGRNLHAVHFPGVKTRQEWLSDMQRGDGLAKGLGGHRHR